MTFLETVSNTMKTDELREKYLSFYESKGHARRPSDVLVPTWDPSVLFTPAGMNQFKDHFLGRVKLDFTRATTCQKCLRTGDIDNVGRTAYHHTFFEMMGNFSFGDYFKTEAIHWAWEFLTDKKWLGLNPEQLSVTVYKDDKEAADIWYDQVGVPTSRIEYLDEDENYWPASAPSQGPDGVCGPCSEIYYHPEGSEKVEIWNLVFTQFNRVGDPPNNLSPLPSKNIDTGMGLERTAATLQGVDTNYHIDILRPIVEAAGEICGRNYVPDSDDGRRLRRITDHVRACTFSIHENVYPGANKEKYIIRRLLRRAVLDGHQMGLREPFLYQLVGNVADQMKSSYPELQETIERVTGVIKTEEGHFLGTIDAGLARTTKIFSEMESNNRTIVSGKEAADLYQTYGFPPELFEQVASEKGLTFNWTEYQKEMELFGEKSGSEQSVLFQDGPVEKLKNTLRSTDFVGYEESEISCTIKGIVSCDAQGESSLADSCNKTGEENPLIIALDQTPFYGESGGQVGDSGEIAGDGFRFIVTDVKKDSDLFLHHGYLAEGVISNGVKATATVGNGRRSGICRAHSATHILHYALQKNVGSHAQQQGSKVEDDLLRFDFTNLEPVSPEQLAAIQTDIDQQVSSSAEVKWETVSLTEAREKGAMMLFGEKYPDPVRMVSMGDFSRELCGGTHLTNTSDVGQFEIVSEEGISAGVRRITAVTGVKAQEYRTKTTESLKAIAAALDVTPAQTPVAVKQLTTFVRDLKKAISGSGKKPEALTKVNAAMSDATEKETLKEVAKILNVQAFDTPSRVSALQQEVIKLQAELEKQSTASAVSTDDLLAQATEIAGVKTIVTEVPGANANLLRQLIDQLRKSAAPCAVMLLAASDDGKVTLIAGVSKDVIEKGLKAGDWVREPAKTLGGSGGGRPDMAQAGGKDVSKLGEAIDQAKSIAQTTLGG